MLWPQLLLLLLPLLGAGEQRGKRGWQGGGRRDPAFPARSPAQNEKFRLHLERWVTVQEGQCALVSCRVTYPSEGYTESTPAYGYWFKKHGVSWRENILVATNNSTQQVPQDIWGRFHLVGDPRAHNCSLDIRDARREDAGTYVFRLERGDYVKYNYVDYPLFVTVTDLTQTPRIQLPRILQSGHPSSITCSAPWVCRRGTPPTFSWIGVDLPSWDTNSPVLSLTSGPQHHGTSLTCRVSFPGAGVSTERTVRLSVDYAPQNLAISVIRKEGSGPTALANGSALPVQEGQSLRLVCMVDSRPPASLSWVRGSLTVKSSASLSPKWAGGAGDHSQSLELELPSVHLDDHGPFLCRAQHSLGSLEAFLRLSVQSPPQLLGPSCSWDDEGLWCSCTSIAWPAPSLRWRLGEQLLEGNSSNTSIKVTFSHGGSWSNSSLRLSGKLHSDLSLSCEALNARGRWGASILLLPGPPAAWTGHVLGAAGGAGITALLMLCLVFIVRSHRKKQVEGAVSQTSLGAVGGTGSGSGGPLNGSLAAIYSGPPGPAAGFPSEKEQEQHHYASLTFHKGKPRNLQAQNPTEYSEIKIRR